jgi:hypothetical protein
VLQDLAPKRLKTLGHSPKLPEGRLHSLSASKRMPVDFFGREGTGASLASIRDGGRRHRHARVRRMRAEAQRMARGWRPK